MNYPDTISMARALVREYSSPNYIQTLIKEAFGEAPSLKAIANMRKEYTESDPSYKRVAHNAKPVPDDFAELAPTMNKLQLQRHYNVSWYGTIDRWSRESGVAVKKYVHPTRRLNMMGRSKQITPVERIKEEDEVAADILRKERFPVNRCNENGTFNCAGKFWRVGRSILNHDEIVEKAKKYV